MPPANSGPQLNSQPDTTSAQAGQPQTPLVTAPAAPVAPPDAAPGTPSAAPQEQQQIVHTSAGSYDDDGRLTLDGMKAAIAAGGSVLIHDVKEQKDGTRKMVGSKLHTTAATLPTSAELARTPLEKDKAHTELEAERKRIDEQLKTLGK
jgi:hypothetical protein